ncbi:MAG: 1-(5-phosphoribosyl)-5-[(5-phosphoribosylamino)methylideneamino]imidazole-4-carboxamide isomerase [Chthoniobacterales bacterium]|nr:1-(5-phosphoribosyl)-5-[(5-phosphoribosylamino)methylideneamino]imidazole-4-carboxamide isomerase [Chthoniobacterales bacterium]
MLYFPAIDLMGGCVVRLERGDPEKRKVYSDNPIYYAEKWVEAGGDWLHLVDLDAAFGGELKNLEKVREICRHVPIPCELGGGMRSREAVCRAMDAGVRRVVLGTRAAEDLEFVSQLVEEFGRDQVAVGVDARNGFVAVRGWKGETNIRAVEFGKKAEAAGAGVLIYTDISTDGMLSGPNFRALEEMAANVSVPLIASGGVSSREDLDALERMGILEGVIIGKALYEGRIPLPFKEKNSDR